MEEEIWKDIAGYDGLYQASNMGNIKSLKNKKEKILKPTINKLGYCRISLCKEGHVITYLVHRIIALTFISNYNNKPQVNHINGIKSDNNVCNLEWVTINENQLHAYNTGLSKGKKGDKNPSSKLNESFVKEIYTSKLKHKKLSEIYGISLKTISNIKCNKSWSHLTKS